MDHDKGENMGGLCFMADFAPLQLVFDPSEKGQTGKIRPKSCNTDSSRALIDRPSATYCKGLPLPLFIIVGPLIISLPSSIQPVYFVCNYVLRKTMHNNMLSAKTL